MRLFGPVSVVLALVAVAVAAAPAPDAGASGSKVLTVADVGQQPGDLDLIALSVQRVSSPVVSMRVVFSGVTASLRRADLGRRLGTTEMGLFRADLRAPARHPVSGIAVLADDASLRVSLKLGSKPELNVRAKPGKTGQTKPGYSGMTLNFTTRAGRFVLAPQRGCTRSVARFDATLQDGSHIKRTTWVGCAR